MNSLGRLPIIVCPCCNNRQTANIKTAKHRVVGLLNSGDQYIICVWHECRNLFTGEVLTFLLDKYDTQQPFETWKHTSLQAG